MDANEIMTVINKEILWCERNPDKAFHAEYRKGFVNGLIQATYLIAEMARVQRRTQPTTDTVCASAWSGG